VWDFRHIAEAAAVFLEALGIAVMVLASIYAAVGTGALTVRRALTGRNFHKLRLRLGRGILFGLEFLVAADIIHTVAVDLSFKTVGVLAGIVLIRTFLSFTLEVELTGEWPWNKTHTPASPEPADR